MLLAATPRLYANYSPLFVVVHFVLHSHNITLGLAAPGAPLSHSRTSLSLSLSLDSSAAVVVFLTSRVPRTTCYVFSLALRGEYARVFPLSVFSPPSEQSAAAALCALSLSPRSHGIWQLRLAAAADEANGFETERESDYSTARRRDRDSSGWKSAARHDARQRQSE